MITKFIFVVCKSMGMRSISTCTNVQLFALLFIFQDSSDILAIQSPRFTLCNSG